MHYIVNCAMDLVCCNVVRYVMDFRGCIGVIKEDVRWLIQFSAENKFVCRKSCFELFCSVKSESDQVEIFIPLVTFNRLRTVWITVLSFLFHDSTFPCVVGE